jgi:hypothetical protein
MRLRRLHLGQQVATGLLSGTNVARCMAASTRSDCSMSADS